MNIRKNCPLCDSGDIRPFAMRYQPEAPHLSRTKCGSCGLVFANPMAEPDELVEFYQNYYDKGNFELFGYKDMHEKKFQAYRDMDESSLQGAFRYALKYKDQGNFLDIGCGLGEPLFLASMNGFKVFGTEYDQDAIDFLSGHLPDVTLHKGDLQTAPFKKESFDFIRFWHVIEHLTDPRVYVKAIRPLLKEDGVLMIGTPEIGNLGHRLYRFLRFFTHRIPGIIDGMEHTVLFNKQTLARLLTEEGFEVIEHRAEADKENYKELLFGDLPLKKKLVRVLQSIFRVNQVLYARKAAE